VVQPHLRRLGDAERGARGRRLVGGGGRGAPETSESADAATLDIAAPEYQAGGQDFDRLGR